jgi:DNA-directed RNA polymerase alpha subunit
MTNITASILRTKVQALLDSGIADPSAQIGISAAQALHLAELLDAISFALEADTQPASHTIASLNLTPRTACKLYASGINTMGDLLRHSEFDLARLPHLDPRAFSEMVDKLRLAGIALRRI